MTKKLPYMQFYVGDYLLSTRKLTNLERGVLSQMLFLIWHEGGSLPYDMADLAQEMKISVREFAEIWGAIEGFFTIRRDRIYNKRISRDIEKAKQTSKKRREAVNIRWQKETTKQEVKQSNLNDTNVLQTQGFVHNQNNTIRNLEIDIDPDTEAKPLKQRKASKAIPNKLSFEEANIKVLPDEWRQMARNMGFEDDETDRIFSNFDKYWRLESPTTKRRDWSLSFENRLEMVKQNATNNRTYPTNRDRHETAISATRNRISDYTYEQIFGSNTNLAEMENFRSAATITIEPRIIK